MTEAREITTEEIKQAILNMVDDTTTYCALEHESVDHAIDKLVQEKFQSINDFDVLTQEMIDDQSETHDGYLDGAEVGELVWGDDECWVSQLTIDGWHFQSSQLIGKCFNDIKDIADYIENDMILKVLSDYNDKAN